MATKTIPESAQEPATARVGSRSSVPNYPIELVTSRFQASKLILAAGLAPTRVTLYYPRFPLGYELAGALPELAPRRAIFRLRGAEFEEAYRAQLERESVEHLLERMTAIAAIANASGLALLCYEDVIGTGLQCHRRIFAAWWEEKTGQRVCELGS